MNYLLNLIVVAFYFSYNLKPTVVLSQIDIEFSE